MNVLELFAKFVVDTSELDKGLDQANNKASSFANGFSNVMGAVGTAAKVATGAMVATAGAVGAVAQQAAGAYSEYQQLSGGIETLFEDQEAVNAVMANASNAYKTAGMSSNQYMDTVISMAASLNKATGDTVESARLADVAITDMSDNVNKMGTTMEMVENAYRGFTRGNFTMLDNLALGYSGSQAGMEELLADAEKISGIKYDISSYADIVNAIHIVQQEMGITGTTATEASETIQGSAAAMKAAWDNLILGLADPNADLGVLIDNMVKSAETALTNMMPTFTRAIEGIGQLVQSLAPVISNELPGLVESVLPPLLDSAATLIDGVVKALPGLLGVIAEQLPPLINTLVEGIGGQLPTILQAVIDIVTQLADSLSKMLPDLITTVTQIVVDLLAVITDPKNISTMIEAATGLVGALVQGLFSALPILLNALPDLISGLLTGLLDSTETLINDLMTKATPIFQDLMPKLYSALSRILPELSEKVLPLLENFATNVIPPLVEQWAGLFRTEVPKLISIMMPIINAFIMGLVQADTLLAKTLPPIIEALAPLLTVVFQAIADTLPVVLPIIADGLKILIVALSDTLVNEYGPVFGEMVSRIFTAIWNEIVELWDTFVQPIIDKIVEWWDGVKSTGENKLAEIWETVTTKLNEIWQSILDFLAPILEILVPYWESIGNLFRSLLNLAVVIFKLVWQTIKNALEKIWSKIQEVWQAISDFISPILDDIKAKVEEIWNGIVDFLTPVIDGLKTTIDEAFQFIYDNAVQPLLDLKDKIEEIFNGIKDFILEFVDGALDWGGDMIKNFSQGITDGLGDLSGAIDTVTGKLSANLEHSVPDEGPLSDDDKWMPDMMQSFAKGIRDNTALVDNAITDAFNFKGMLGGNGTLGNGGLITPTASQPIQVTLVLDKQQLGKVVFDLNKQESRRMGVSLANV